MTQYDVMRLGLILAHWTEVEGMKAENKEREHQGKALAYGEESFQQKAEQIRNVTYAHDQQL